MHEQKPTVKESICKLIGWYSIIEEPLTSSSDTWALASARSSSFLKISSISFYISASVVSAKDFYSMKKLKFVIGVNVFWTRNIIAYTNEGWLIPSYPLEVIATAKIAAFIHENANKIAIIIFRRAFGLLSSQEDPNIKTAIIRLCKNWIPLTIKNTSMYELWNKTSFISP